MFIPVDQRPRVLLAHNTSPSEIESKFDNDRKEFEMRTPARIYGQFNL